MPNGELQSHVHSTTDFYALLSLSTPNPTPSELQRAWRRTALKYHPDKVEASDLVAAEKFHLAQIAFDVLSDTTLKAEYDRARTAREQRARQEALFEGKRRKMKEDLEGRERGGKRVRVDGGMDGEGTTEGQAEKEMRRLAEEGRRMRDLFEAKKAKERDEAAMREKTPERNGHGVSDVTDSTPEAKTPGTSSVRDIDRTVKVRFPLTEETEHLDGAKLQALFTRFGNVENAFLLKAKKKKPLTGVIIFASIVGAHAAILDAAKTDGEPWRSLTSVEWAEGKEPDFLGHAKSRTPATSAGSPPVTPMSKGSGIWKGLDGVAREGGEGLRKVPSFASFKGGLATPGRQGSPSLGEITMIRLRQREAEKRRLEAEIRKADEDAEVDGSGNAAEVVL